jgi:hypothetical protein
VKSGVVRSCLAAWRAWLAILVVLLVPRAALAAIDIAIPTGWADAAPGSAAADRARAWASDGATVQHVLATTISDDFAETLAVLSVPGALDLAELEDPALATRRLTEAGAVRIGAEEPPQQVQLIAVDGGTTAIVGRWADDDLVMRMALVPEGATHTVLLLAVPRRMDVLYADVLDDALASLRGAVAPTRPFPRARWLAIAWLGWLVGAIAGGVIVVRSMGTFEVARRVAVIAVAAAAVVAVGLAIALADADAALAAAGTSAVTLLVQVSGGGLVVAGLVLLGARLWERRITPIQSAPGGGTYGAWTPAARRSPVPALRLAPSDEPAAHLEHIGVPQQEDDDDDEMASLATAQIRLDGKAPGGRFGPR